jgi:hypothetical protein
MLLPLAVPGRDDGDEDGAAAAADRRAAVKVATSTPNRLADGFSKSTKCRMNGGGGTGTAFISNVRSPA